MKVLLVDNNTEHLEALIKGLEDHDVQIQKYRPGLEFADQDKDLIVLSGGGGEGLEITDKITSNKLWYQDEMDYIKMTDKPIFGICMGFELIVSAHGGKVLYRPKIVNGISTAYLSDKGQKTFGHKAINQVESHFWYVPEVSENQFEILGHSTSGVEIVKHKNKQQLGVQFHPEEGGTLSLSNLLTTLTV